MIRYRLHNIDDGGVSFQTFHNLFIALCTNGDARCEFYSEVEFWFRGDTIGRYRLCEEPIFYQVPKIEESDGTITCKSRMGQYIEIFKKDRTFQTQKKPTSYEIIRAEISENWVFNIRETRYKLRKYSNGNTKELAFRSRPRYSIEVTSSDIEKAIDLFGRYSNGIKENLEVEVK